MKTLQKKKKKNQAKWREGNFKKILVYVPRERIFIDADCYQLTTNNEKENKMIEKKNSGGARGAQSIE